jgi:hypothetical protein
MRTTESKARGTDGFVGTAHGHEHLALDQKDAGSTDAFAALRQNVRALLDQNPNLTEAQKSGLVTIAEQACSDLAEIVAVAKGETAPEADDSGKGAKGVDFLIPPQLRGAR